jgi:hypothetical protein
MQQEILGSCVIVQELIRFWWWWVNPMTHITKISISVFSQRSRSISLDGYTKHLSRVTEHQAINYRP